MHCRFYLDRHYCSGLLLRGLIFDTALSRIESLMGQALDPSDVAHVGDDFLCDIVGAKRAKFKAIWLDGHEHKHNCIKKHEYQKGKDEDQSEGIVADAIISHIKDLPTALTSLKS